MYILNSHICVSWHGQWAYRHIFSFSFKDDPIISTPVVFGLGRECEGSSRVNWLHGPPGFLSSPKIHKYVRTRLSRSLSPGAYLLLSTRQRKLSSTRSFHFRSWRRNADILIPILRETSVSYICTYKEYLDQRHKILARFPNKSHEIKLINACSVSIVSLTIGKSGLSYVPLFFFPLRINSMYSTIIIKFKCLENISIKLPTPFSLRHRPHQHPHQISYL